MTNPTATLIALVTGANRGLGLETSRQLAVAGTHVLMAGRDLDKTEAAAESLRRECLDVEAVRLDITDTAQAQSVRAQIGERFGHLDILVNNAGAIFEGGFFQNNAATVDIDALRQTFEVNLFSTVALTQTMLPLLEASKAGRIVNVSSVLASLTIHSDPNGPLQDLKPIAYDASKAALNMFTVGLADALKNTKIKVNSAHPGWVKTDLGTDAAPMEIVDGAKTAVALSLLGPDGPSGRFIHLGEELPW